MGREQDLPNPPRDGPRSPLDQIRMSRRRFIAAMGAAAAGGIIAERGILAGIAGISDRFTGLADLSETERKEIEWKILKHQENMRRFISEYINPDFLSKYGGLNLYPVTPGDAKDLVENYKRHRSEGTDFSPGYAQGYLGRPVTGPELDITFRNSYDNSMNPGAIELLMHFDRGKPPMLPGISVKQPRSGWTAPQYTDYMPSGTLIKAAHLIYNLPEGMQLDTENPNEINNKYYDPKTGRQITLYGHNNYDLNLIVNYPPQTK